MMRRAYLPWQIVFLQKPVAFVALKPSKYTLAGGYWA